MEDINHVEITREAFFNSLAWYQICENFASDLEVPSRIDINM